MSRPLSYRSFLETSEVRANGKTSKALDGLQYHRITNVESDCNTTGFGLWNPLVLFAIYNAEYLAVAFIVQILHTRSKPHFVNWAAFKNVIFIEAAS